MTERAHTSRSKQHEATVGSRSMWIDSGLGPDCSPQLLVSCAHLAANAQAHGTGATDYHPSYSHGPLLQSASVPVGT